MKLPPFSLERYFERFEFSVPYMLAASDCESVSIAELLAEDSTADTRFKELRLGYTEPRGHPELRARISTLYQKQDPDSIIVCNGAEEAIFLFMNAMLSRGDRVIVQSPCYQSLQEIPRAIGCEVVPWSATATSKWSPDLDQLNDLMTPRTRMLIVNSPHNPTGFHFSHDAYQYICKLAREKNINLFSDEVYRLLEHNEADRVTAAADSFPGAVSLGVLSKSFGLAGLRIGWIATHDRKIIEQLSKFKDYTSICNAAPSEYLAMIALEKWEKLLERNRNIILKNKSELRSFIDHFDEQVEWIEPIAGCVALPWFRDRGITYRFYEDLAINRGVLLLPGSLFGLEDHYFRIGYGRQSFSEGLKALANSLLGGFRAKQN